MQSLEPKHPRAIRWMHWINVPVLTIMIWSGLLIYWANDVYADRLSAASRCSTSSPTGSTGRLALSMAWPWAWRTTSPSCGSFAINGFLYVLYTFLSGEWRHLLPNRHTPREAWDVVLHDLDCARSRCRAPSSTAPSASPTRASS